MLFDAVCGLLLWNMFGEQGLLALGMVCCVSFLRLASNLNAVLATLDVKIEDEEEEC